MAGRRPPHLYAAVYMMLRRGDSILLSQRKATGFMDGWYTLPAGHVRPGERLAWAVAREAKEEIGVEIDPSDVSIATVTHRRLKGGGREYLDAFARVPAWRGEIANMEPAKCTSLAFFPLDRLPDRTIDYVRRGIEASLAGAPFSEHGWEEE